MCDLGGELGTEREIEIEIERRCEIL